MTSAAMQECTIICDQPSHLMPKKKVYKSLNSSIKEDEYNVMLDMEFLAAVGGGHDT